VFPLIKPFNYNPRRAVLITEGLGSDFIRFAGHEFWFASMRIFDFPEWRLHAVKFEAYFNPKRALFARVVLPIKACKISRLRLA
jgi:hypothetical protein